MLVKFWVGCFGLWLACCVGGGGVSGDGKRAETRGAGGGGRQGARLRDGTTCESGIPALQTSSSPKKMSPSARGAGPAAGTIRGARPDAASSSSRPPPPPPLARLTPRPPGALRSLAAAPSAPSAPVGTAPEMGGTAKGLPDAIHVFVSRAGPKTGGREGRGRNSSSLLSSFLAPAEGERERATPGARGPMRGERKRREPPGPAWA